ncbi:MAG: hypothetical protein N3A01_07040 [Bacteroidales bacterium]|nr:hypothetical protein [Bacteroidales bacterium]
MRCFVLTYCLICSYALNYLLIGQVSVSSTGIDPHSSAMVEIAASDKGVLIPRVSLSSTTDINTISNPAPSLIVYNTNANMTNGNGAGFYYWDGNKWIYLIATTNGPGSAGQVLTSQGSGNAPQWTTLSTGGGSGTSVQMISNPSSSAITWRNCANYCATLEEGTYTDWRMPTTGDVVYYMSNWDKVKDSNGNFLTSQPAYTNMIWVGQPVLDYNTVGQWLNFRESTGAWTWCQYDQTAYCRCVR